MLMLQFFKLHLLFECDSLQLALQIHVRQFLLLLFLFVLQRQFECSLEMKEKRLEAAQTKSLFAMLGGYTKALVGPERE